MKTILTLLTCVLIYSQLDAAEGRYMISRGKEGLFVIDTQEGDIWRYCSFDRTMEKIEYNSSNDLDIVPIDDDEFTDVE